MSERKICIITGARADYGLIYSLMKAIQGDDNLVLQVIATGMHLSPEFGLTYKELEADGFDIDQKVEMLLSTDTPSGIAKSVGLGIIGLADALASLRPDLLVLPGDRYEILAAAQTALILKIPAAHIAGGDSTEGAFDEAIRHSITKMSHLHFVTNGLSAERVKQLGENPEHIYNVGSPSIDRLKSMITLSRTQLEDALGFRLLRKNILITFHPATLDNEPSCRQFSEVLKALHSLGSNTGLIFAKPNADPEGRSLSEMLESFVSSHENAISCTSFGSLYPSVISHVDLVAGNSSSGLYEVPSFKKPTVNIGDRQKGRLSASSVTHCRPIKDEIEKAIRESFEKDLSDTVNPYGDGNSAEKILEVLKAIPDYNALLKKHFYSFNNKGVS